MQFQHPSGRKIDVLLPRKSLLVLSEESRYLWTHWFDLNNSHTTLLIESEESQYLWTHWFGLNNSHTTLLIETL